MFSAPKFSKVQCSRKHRFTYLRVTWFCCEIHKKLFGEFVFSDPGSTILLLRNMQYVLANSALLVTYTLLLNFTINTPFSKSRDSQLCNPKCTHSYLILSVLIDHVNSCLNQLVTWLRETFQQSACCTGSLIQSANYLSWATYSTAAHSTLTHKAA